MGFLHSWILLWLCPLSKKGSASTGHTSTQKLAVTDSHWEAEERWDVEIVFRNACARLQKTSFPVLGSIASLIDWGFEAEFSNIFEKFKFSSLNYLYLHFRAGGVRGSFHSNFCKLGNWNSLSSQPYSQTNFNQREFYTEDIQFLFN